MSNIGDGLTLTALPWLATTVTSNALYVSLIPTAMRLPWLLFSLPAGVLIDLLPRKRLMVLMNMGRAVITALLAIFVFDRKLHGPLDAYGFSLRYDWGHVQQHYPDRRTIDCGA
jgi:MFS family permease